MRLFGMVSKMEFYILWSLKSECQVDVEWLASDQPIIIFQYCPPLIANILILTL